MNQAKTRITALDFARALAIFGMIIVNYKLAMQAEHSGPGWLQFGAGLFEGRAAALFVILAGAGVALMTMKARSSKDKELVRRNRTSFYKRAAFLLAAGLLLLLLEWSADILHYYAVFMLAAALWVTVSNRVLLGMFAAILFTSQLFLIVFDYTKGWDSHFKAYPDFWTFQGFLRNLLFNGYHPILPWICFFLIGMWMVRAGWLKKEYRSRLLIFSVLGVVIFETLSFVLIKWSSPVLGSEAALYLFGTKPMPPTMLYILSGTCSAIAVLTICQYIIDKYEQTAWVQAIIHTGQLSLTHYVGHVVIGLFLLQLSGYLDNGSLVFSTLYGSAYFILSVIFSHLWRKRMQRGPIEWLLRKVGS